MNRKSNTSGPYDLPFNLLLDKYRKELLNLGMYNKTVQQRDYWLEKSNYTYTRLIEMYGDKMLTVPYTVFKTRVRGDEDFYWQNVTTDEIFADKKVLIFGLPGAFTPTCTNSQLPGFEALYDELCEYVDEIYCISVNDAFVMYQWAKSLGIEKVKMLPDGNGEFTRKIGMLVDKSNLGFGMRSWRYAAVVDDGIFTDWYIEEGLEDNCPADPYEESHPDTILEDFEILDAIQNPVLR